MAAVQCSPPFSAERFCPAAATAATAATEDAAAPPEAEPGVEGGEVSPAAPAAAAWRSCSDSVEAAPAEDADLLDGRTGE